MIMEETRTETSNLIPKRRYRKHKDKSSDISSIYSSKNSTNSSTASTNDWHQLLLTRLKPAIPEKHRILVKDDSKLDGYSSKSLEDSKATLQSMSDTSSILDNHQVVLSDLDAACQSFNSSFPSSFRRGTHYVKNSTVHRTTDHITSLKRRVRKQQIRHILRQPASLQETTYQLPTRNNLLLISYPEQVVLPRRYRQKKSTCAVSLPPLINSTRTLPIHIQGLKLNLYGY